MIRAAGILILATKTNRALFLQRGPGSDYPGMWCTPGGRIEEGEETIDAAIRETEEETGGFKAKKSDLRYWTRRVALQESADGASPTPAPGSPVIEEAPASILDTLVELAKPEAGAVIPPGAEEVDFTTFVLRIEDEFTPDVEKSGEHIAYAWAPITSPPAPLHPGVRVALDRFSMDELGVARAMVAGQLTSPQEYGNITLFAARITGTGHAHRGRKLGKDGKVEREDEFVWRNPDHYLNEDFLARCNGLPVVLQHPEGKMLTTKDYKDTNIGSVFLPYILGNEVWGIIKIFDAKAAAMMATTQLSTSPGVVWKSAEANTTSIIDGQSILIEGKPSLLDHLAVCWQGVWDKGGQPKGISTIEARKDDMNMTKEELEAMLKDRDTKVVEGLAGGIAATQELLKTITARLDAEEEKKEAAAKDAARKDAENFNFSKKDGDDDKDWKAKLDAEEMALCDSLMKAGDSEEDAKKTAKDARKDAEEAESKKDEDGDAKEKAKKDAEEKEEAAKDAANLLAENAELKKRLDALDKRTAPLRDEDYAAFGKAQSRFDEAFSALGQACPRPIAGESLLAYLKRGTIELKPFSKTWKDAEMNIVAADDAAFNVIKDQIINEAIAVARSDASVPVGQLREVEKTEGGHTTREFFGEPLTWMEAFMPAHRFAKIERQASK